MIQIDSLTKYFGHVCAVDHISLGIRKGEVLGLLGPNGAGKLEIKKLIGYLPESAPLYPDMIVYDFLNFVADVRNLSRDGKVSRIKELANQCGLNEVMHKPVHELSKGYKQRVGLAQAMMNDPEILVLVSRLQDSIPTRSWKSGKSSRKSARKKRSFCQRTSSAKQRLPVTGWSSSIKERLSQTEQWKTSKRKPGVIIL
jgi:ABC-2 type transport system ATP-binding protein